MTQPEYNADFWQSQAQQLASDLERIATDLRMIAESAHSLAERVPRAVQQAADLGLMREQHDMHNVVHVLRGEGALNIERDGRQAADHAQLEQIRALLARLPCVVREAALDDPTGFDAGRQA